MHMFAANKCIFMKKKQQENTKLIPIVDLGRRRRKKSQSNSEPKPPQISVPPHHSLTSGGDTSALKPSLSWGPVI